MARAGSLAKNCTKVITYKSTLVFPGLKHSTETYKIFKIIKQQQEQRARRLLKGEGHNPVVPLLCFVRRVSNNRSFCPLYGYQTFLSRLNCYELILDTFYCEYVDFKKKLYII